MELFFYILGTLMGIFVAYLCIPHPLKEILFRGGREWWQGSRSSSAPYFKKKKQDDLPLLPAIIIFLLIIASICGGLIIALIKLSYHEYL